jgi:hypothetical protein
MLNAFEAYLRLVYFDTRYEYDQEGFNGGVQDISTGITASRLEDIYM